MAARFPPSESRPVLAAVSSLSTETTTAPVIQARGLTKSYPEGPAVRGIDLTVPAGQTFGFLGPNGAGKTTTIAMLCTLTPPSAGRAWVAGHDVVADADQVRRHIGLVFQDTTL